MRNKLLMAYHLVVGWGALCILAITSEVAHAQMPFDQPLNRQARRQPAEQAPLPNVPTLMAEDSISCLTLKELKLKPISQLNVAIGPKAGVMPPDCSAEEFASTPMDEVNQTNENPEGMVYNWEAPALWHKPLYFEDAPLERYGLTCGPRLQPAVSVTRFFATIPLLPYKLALDHPRHCQYDLGYYRPGDCVPHLRQTLPLRWKPALAQTATVAGLILLIP